MAKPISDCSSLEVMTLFLLHHLHDGCERNILAALLDISVTDTEKIVRRLTEQNFIEEKNNAVLHCSDTAPHIDAIRTHIVEKFSEQVFPPTTLANYIYAYISENYRVFFAGILCVIKDFDDRNLPVHIFCAYALFAEFFQQIDIDTSDIDFCNYIIRTSIEIQEIIHLHPYNSNKELIVSTKLRDLALKIGDQRTTCCLDLRIGAMIINLRSVSTNNDYFMKMKLAKDMIFGFGDDDIIIRSAPMIMMYYFFNGDYDDAINLFYRVSQIKHITKIKTYSRILFTYVIFSAINRGSYDLAHEFIQWGKNGALQSNKPSNVAMFDSYLAYLLILENKPEKALQIINDIMENENYSITSYASLIASRLVSFFQYTQGNLRKSHTSFISHIATRPQSIFHKNYISFHFVLDLLGAYALAGLPSIVGFEIEKELNFALNAPVKLGRGVAHRIQAELLAKKRGWAAPEVREHLDESLALLQAVKAPLPTTALYWALSRYYQAVDDPVQGSKMLDEAWNLHKNYRQPPWPEDLPIPAVTCGIQEKPPVSNSLTSFCIKLLKSRSVFANSKSIKIFLNELLSMLLSTMEMTTGEVYRITPEEQKSVAYINYGEMFNGASKHFVAPEKLIFDVLEKRSSVLFAGGKALVGGAKLAELNDNAVISLGFFYLYDDTVRYVILLHGTLKVCKGNLYPEVLELLDNFIRPEIENFLSTVSIATAKIELAPSSSLLEAQEIIYCSKEMAKVVNMIDSIADKTVSVLILGESGVGKELVARRLHSRSRCSGEFVPVNISNIPSDLFESELFGYERGSFTGAAQKKIGLFELADKGTLFLDEVGDAPYPLQVKLLRVIQEKEFMRVGGISKIHSSFRLVSATNKNLERAIADGTFREDFFYRLGVVTLTVPPLRERKDDIFYLAKIFRQYYARVHGLADKEFPDTLQQQMHNYEWPGNVRQLRHFVENYCLFSTSNSIASSDTLWQIGQNSEIGPPPLALVAGADSAPTAEILDFFTNLPTLKQLDEQYFEHIYAKCGGVVGGEEGIAAVLDISRATAYSWIERLKLNKVYKKTVSRLQ